MEVENNDREISMWRSILRTGRRFGFTSTETGVVVFLALATMAGETIRLVRGERIPERSDVELAYREHDSLFAALSNKAFDDAAATPRLEAAVVRTDSAVTRSGGPSGTRPIDINTASEAELDALPGIGPATAAKIVAYRLTVGRFREVEDIMRVPSIGRKKFERIQALIRVSR
jgi:competence ComEA-like helix-hairpin-helix protein